MNLQSRHRRSHYNPNRGSEIGADHAFVNGTACSRRIPLNRQRCDISAACLTH
jgi:hypothetical protein